MILKVPSFARRSAPRPSQAREGAPGNAGRPPAAPHRKRKSWRRLLPWLRWGTVAILSSLLALDFAFPPLLPQTRDTSTLVVARDGTPLRAFADAQGVWR